ncbi:Ribokinase [Echinococcus granulosus]|uniref:Ribokinase n=1 Tax=Echinococcus granulosus TaxID=6210 RepID=U6IYJ4_ECHGR|nr:Ribokinase [Echinococcus granulosus]EUB63481.1 Ribokinase [Echinococcus granulosus]KAH9285323.1 Ribokinase [Echinococcus granulosus]CDS16113.1 ribokinase [Echinococcus granulosus]
MMEVTIVGSINTDLMCYTDKFPIPGETIVGAKFAIGFGGKGANQCVAARKLGAKTSLVSRVGDDYFGRDYIEYLKRVGVETDTIKISHTANSGVAVITVERDYGNNNIVVIPGANEEISVDDVEEAHSKGLVSKKVMGCQFESNAEATLYALEQAKKRGLVTILDPAPAPNPGSPFLPLLKRFMEASTMVCPNETEAAVLTGIPVPDFVGKSSFQIAESALEWLLHLEEAGVTYPLVTLGANGVVGLLPKCEGDSTRADDVTMLKSDLITSDKAIFHIRCPVYSKVVDTTAAGDCFAGSLAFYMARYPEITIVEKLRRSVWIASQSVLRHGTQASFYERHELPDELFESAEFRWPQTSDTCILQPFVEKILP